MTCSGLFGRPVNLLAAFYFTSFGLLLVTTGHGTIVLWLNNYHNSFFDIFFKYWTYLGDGMLLAVFGMILLLFNYYRFFLFLIAAAFHIVFVHLFKQWLWAGEPRPKAYFAGHQYTLNFVEGVTIRTYDSFPSGHTASGFLLCFYLMLLVRNTVVRIALLITAVLIGLSRMYLLQHFARDVYVGGLFGVLSLLLSLLIFSKKQTNPSLQRGLLKK